MNRFTLTVAACGLFLAASIADAQQQPGQGQGRGRGGPGGGGFGFGGPGQTQGPLDLIGREPVQKDLALKEDQVAKVETMTNDIREERRSAFGQTNFGDFQNLSQEERTKRFAELQAKAAESRKKVDEKFKPMLSEILTEEQEKRLDQIVLQVAGVPALLEADLAKKLDLSKDQQDKLTAANKEYTDKRTELMPQGFGGRPPGGQGGQGNAQETFTKLRELGETRDKQMLAVLTADQKAKYDAAKGKEFDVASVRGFGGRGPGGGAPGGPGGAGGRPGGEGRPGAAPGAGRPRPAQPNNNQ